MYKLLAAVALIACVNAHGWSDYMGGNGMNQGGNYGNNMGNQMGLLQMLQQQMNGGMNQQGQGYNNYNNMNQGYNNMNQGFNNMNMGMNGGMRGGNNNGVMNLLTLALLQNIMGGQQRNNGGNYNNNGNNQGGSRGDDDDDMQHDMEGLEEYMQWKMMTEMSDMMMNYMEYKEKEKYFTQAMEAMCYMVNATYTGYARRGLEVFNQTTDESMKMLEQQLEGMTEAQKLEFTINKLFNNQQEYSEIFMRFATWACMAGDEFAKAVTRMERMRMPEDDRECKK